MSLVETVPPERSRRQLIVVVAMAALISSVLIAAYFFAFRSPYIVAFNGLRAADAATIVAELDKKKTPYKLKDGGASILVPADQVDTVRLGIASADLPLKGGVGFELFNKSDIGLTEFAQKINYQRALQGELARTIMGMAGVNTARVHLSLPDQGLFAEDRRPPKASVTVVTMSGRELAPASVWGIQQLVAAAVPDLEAERVVILDEQGVIISAEARPAESVPPQGVSMGSSASVGANLPVFASPAPLAQPHATPAVNAKSGAAKTLAGSMWTGLSLLLVLGAVVAIYWGVLRRRRPRPRLTARERAEYVDRLKSLLNREQSHAHSL